MKKVMVIFAAMAFFGFLTAQNMTLNWANAYNSATTTSSYGLCVTTYSGNDVITGGVFQASAPGIDFDPTVGVSNLTSTGTTTDMYITRVSALNAFHFAIKIDGPGVEVPTHMISNGTDIYVVGYFTLTANFNSTTSKTSAGGDDMFIARYDINGNLIWVDRFGAGGTDRAMGICFDHTGHNILVCGLFSGTVAFDPSYASWSQLMSVGGSMDAFFAEYNSGGGLVSVAKKIGGPGDDAANGIATDASSRIIVCGSYGQPACDFDPSPGIIPISCVGSTDCFLASYTSAGGYNWANTFGTANKDELLDVTTDAADDIYTAGSFYQGTISLSPTVSGTPFSFTNSAPASGFADIIVAKCSSANVWQWAGRIGDTDDDVANSIGVDNTNHVYISGYFQNTAVFDFLSSSSASTVSSPGNRDIFMARYYANSGIYNDVDVISGAGMDRGHGMSVNTALSAVYVCGEFGPPNADFDTNPGLGNTFYLPSLASSGTNAYLARYDWSSLPPVHAGGGSTKGASHSTTRIAENTASTPSVYPNPVSGTLFIENINEGAVAEIYSLDGQKAGSWNANGNDKLVLDLSNFAEGIYLLRIMQTDGSFTTEKIIVQH